jgi:2,3,4,5-tetrahydropyridine-2-carboxylate N-succinyltransferase
MEEVQRILEEAFARRRSLEDAAVERAFMDLLEGLEAGTLRAAAPDGKGGWQVHPWVKAGILVGFRLGRIVDMSVHPHLPFFDKHTFPTLPLNGVERRIRIVPGGSSVRRGVYLAADVVVMPPAYVNVGARVEEGSMVDSHALVGSCAQVGRSVHISAAAQIGGVLEPPGARPVILEDGVLVGGNCGVFEGTLVRQRAVLGAGVILTGSTPVFDLPNGRILRPQAGGGPEIPANAVVVPGSRMLRGEFAREQGLSVYTPVIVKYRDAQTDARTALEEALR